MFFTVTFISTAVHFYSCGYMAQDPHIQRFMSYLSLFTFFMLILVSADNFLQLFVGWEGVGLCSYLLINFWFTRLQANKAALKALMFNRVGDFAFILGLLVIFDTFQSLDFSIVFSLVPYFVKKKICIFSLFFNSIDIICFLLFLGCMSKSAQIGLHT
jgi:NADH:ubiquinone oxidoreductase subunit 5 (subunit L)/multisubunit Na+/H+ antiporter MnhA subunit